MKLTFRKLIIENYGMFQDRVEIDFQSSGVHQIFGHDKTNEEKRNGIGKSQLFEAISFALYGAKTKRKIDSLINKETKKNLAVLLVFGVDEKIYRVERYRKHTKQKNNLLLFEIEGDEEKEISLAETKLTQEEIEKIIKINYEIFMKIILVSIEKSKNFFDLTVADKYDLLESVIKVEFDQFEKKITKLNTENNKDIDKFTKAKVSLDANIDTIVSQMKRLFKQYKEIKNEKEVEIPSFGEDFEKQKREHEDLKVKYTGLIETLEILEKEIKQSERTISSYKIDIKNNEKIINSGKLTCPSCDHSWHTNQDEIDKAELENKELIEKTNTLLKTQANDILAVVSLKSTIKSTLDLIKDDMDDLIEEYNEYKNQIKESADEKNTKLKLLKKEFKSFITQKNEKKVTQIKVEEKLYQLEKKKEKIDFWKEAFNPKSQEGIKMFIRNKFVPTFNAVLSNIVDIIFDGELSIKFDESFLEYIVYKNSEYDYIEFSRGEKAKLNLCVSFALLEIIDINLAKSNVLFLDEVFSGIDSDTIHKFIDIVKTTYQNRGTYVISHEIGIDSAMKTDQIIEIVKESEFSSRIVAQ